jgi:hypothetical protein
LRDRLDDARVLVDSGRALRRCAGTATATATRAQNTTFAPVVFKSTVMPSPPMIALRGAFPARSARAYSLRQLGAYPRSVLSRGNV